MESHISGRCAEPTTAWQSLATSRGRLGSGVRTTTAAPGALQNLNFCSDHHQVVLKPMQTRKPVQSWAGGAIIRGTCESKPYSWTFMTLENTSGNLSLGLWLRLSRLPYLHWKLHWQVSPEWENEWEWETPSEGLLTSSERLKAFVILSPLFILYKYFSWNLSLINLFSKPTFEQYILWDLPFLKYQTAWNLSLTHISWTIFPQISLTNIIDKYISSNLSF